jgi:hypothetical protein
VQQQRLGDAIEPEDYVELGDGLWRSLTSGYRFAVDRTYLNSLPTETAQRLYSYFTKKDYKSRFYEERVVGLGRRSASPLDCRGPAYGTQFVRPTPPTAPLSRSPCAQRPGAD